jgi:hypothetical protein
VPATVLYAFPDFVLTVVPDGLPLGPVDVTLTRGGIAAGSVPFEVIATSVPEVLSVSPSRLAREALAFVRGRHLGGPLDEVAVAVGGAAAEHVLAFGEVLFFVVPPDATSGALVVTVDGVASAPFDVSVGALPAPAIASLEPAAASRGSLVRVRGTDFAVLGQRTRVSFGGAEAAIFAFAPDSLLAIVPPGAADGDVVVTVGSRSSAGAAFDVTERGPPTIAAVEPTTLDRASVARVRGTDLVDLSAWAPGALPPSPPFGALRVVVAGTTAWFVLPDETGLRFLVPPSAPVGATTLVVETNGTSSAAVPVTIR